MACDDAANNWGVELIGICYPRRQSYDKHCRSFKMAVDSICKPFMLEKTTACGSDANLWVVNHITGGNTSSCLFGCGSYVAGDSSALQYLSTSDFDVAHSFSMIQNPQSGTLSDAAKQQTIALPYHIPCSNCQQQNCKSIRILEEQCLRELHLRSIIGEMSGHPIKALMLELILAGNGGTLSDRFLIRLGKLCQQHRIFIAVDEIMTGGRTGHMLLTNTKPKEFLDHVLCVTLGKWPGVGLVLIHEDIEWTNLLFQDIEITRRGASTIMGTDQSLSTWKAVVPILGKADSRRQAILAKLNVEPEEAWGQGAMVFSDRVRQGFSDGLKGRYLLRLESLPLDKFTMVKKDEFAKPNICECITRTVSLWLQQSQSIGNPIEREFSHFLSVTPNIGHSNKKQLLALLSEFQGGVGSTKRLGDITKVVAKLENAGLASMMLKTKKRKRGFVGTDRLHFTV